jgi:2',3'-cyclic-nucleotide 2'-phosphodiesterase (5'-nucleotidase family)
VIALTHMRTPNDIRLAESVPEIDLILGGHDHVYEKRKVSFECCLCFNTVLTLFLAVKTTCTKRER